MLLLGLLFSLFRSSHARNRRRRNPLLIHPPPRFSFPHPYIARQKETFFLSRLWLPTPPPSSRRCQCLMPNWHGGRLRSASSLSDSGWGLDRPPPLRGLPKSIDSTLPARDERKETEEEEEAWVDEEKEDGEDGGGGMRQERRRSSKEEGVRSPPLSKGLFFPSQIGSLSLLLSLLRHREEGIPMAIFSLSGHTKEDGARPPTLPPFNTVWCYIFNASLCPPPLLPPSGPKEELDPTKVFLPLFSPAERERERSCTNPDHNRKESHSVQLPPFFLHNLSLVTLPPSFLPSVHSRGLGSSTEDEGTRERAEGGALFSLPPFLFPSPLLLLLPLFQLTEA